MQPPSDAERETIAKILRRLRRQKTAVGRQTFSAEELRDAMRREAFKQEMAGAQYVADLLDACDTLILAMEIKIIDTERFRGR